MSRRHGWYDRVFAWFMARESGRYEALVEERKRRLMETLSGVVVEIGSGTGANLRYLPRQVTVIGLDPNPFMPHYYRRQASATARPSRLVRGRAEALPFPDESVDAVLSTLVLCSVGDQDTAISEILRILRPGGKFLFVEHVAAPEGTWLRRIQGWVRPAWRRVGDGCEPDRTTGSRLLAAGFDQVDLDRFRVPLPLVSPHIAGVAVK